ncbi:MAG: Rne/Rng family ribonuclease, partial [Ilumatobacteraceae bacterium]
MDNPTTDDVREPDGAPPTDASDGAAATPAETTSHTTPAPPTRRTAAGDDASDVDDVADGDDDDADGDDDGDDTDADGEGGDVQGEPTVRTGPKKRRRGSRGGKNRKKPATSGAGQATGDVDGADHAEHPDHPELPDRASEGRPSPEAAAAAVVRKPQIGDTRPAPPPAAPAVQMPGGATAGAGASGGAGAGTAKKKRRRSGKGRGGAGGSGGQRPEQSGRSQPGPVAELDPEVLERRRGRERKGRPVGRYLMCVQVRPHLTQVAVLEGRTLIEHYVSRPADDVSQIHGNIYVGKVQNVLPGMEAAFVDIGTPKNAVLYRGDVQYDSEDIVEKSTQPRIEQMLRAKQLIVCQVTKNPIGAKGARLTQEVSLPGRFVVLVPNSRTYGISKRLPDDVRKRLRNILDRVKPAEHGLIVRTAAEHATEQELRADMTRLLDQWAAIEAKAKKVNGPALLYREPELAVRVIREEFNAEYRGIVIDDERLHADVHDYVTAFNPELADRVEHYDADEEGLPLFEKFHIHEQLHKALDRKVWLPSGGSLIIEHTEALTVIDVNTGKNVGTTNLEETVFKNNLEAAEEVAKQLRLRDIGGIVVIDFIDMEI